MYGGTMDKYMCTGICPCDVKHKDLYKAATAGKGFLFTGKQARKWDYAALTLSEQSALGNNAAT